MLLWRAGAAQILDADVYAHVKGWSRARVTHIDIELEGLEGLVGGAGRGVFARATGVAGGVRIEPFRGDWGMELRGEDPALRVLEPGESCVVYVGGKAGGLFIGFSRPYHRVLEELVARHYGIAPRRGRR